MKNFKTLTAITSTIAAAAILTACGNNSLELENTKTYEIGVESPREYLMNYPAYTTNETWEIKITGVYDIGTTDSDPEGTCYAITQEATLKNITIKDEYKNLEEDNTTENGELVVQRTPDVELTYDGRRTQQLGTVPGNCNLQPLRDKGYRGLPQIAPGETADIVGIEYVPNTLQKKLDGVLVGFFQQEGEYAQATYYNLTPEEVKTLDELPEAVNVE